ncbi:hypothetical protein ASPZODRAFT_55754 [Penicilliopsis zonata CBS 506.65]|uniref:3-phytase n=1 Tax=Penicilliopsis zonata CBS 506.65 TaxID=1073090 RepID=A0A1L9SXG6_9EURO|nr:hypothetical protein ASPZODRAFT_55754 [Penicilliopsis zonata CBS 506.65]OJJ51781.1 hypothetical protein ASPZODRAFT_55754 [Penicilliopsis zonata CBS 506.65]
MQEFLVVLALALQAAAVSSSPSSPSPAPTGAVYASGFDITTSWANLSPYKDSPGFGLPKGVPRGCELSQVHVLHRHAQRYPTAYPLDGDGMAAFNSKLVEYAAAHPNVTVGRGALAFLADWEYVMGTDTLLASGAATEATSGAGHWDQYGRALYRAGAGMAAWNESLNVFPNGTARPKPVFRTTSQARILESARWWLSGFFGNAGANSSADLYELVIIPETDPYNNTLASYDSCPGDMSEGDDSAEVFVPRYTQDALARLSALLPADFNLTTADVLAMQNLCPYEYATLGASAFCSLFTEQEWRDFEYQIELQFYGDYGFGSPSGRAQGIGYVLELAARLEAKLIFASDTSINYTYDDNTAQFPLHQPLYMDMSHDDIILSVLTALGLSYFRYGPDGLPEDVAHAPEPRTFHLNEMTPFGARLASEVWTCPAGVSFDELAPVLYRNPDLSATPNTTDYLRFVLNNAPLPLDGLASCANSSQGFCPLQDFLQGVPQLHEEAEYQYSCFGNYTTGHQVGDGVPE